MTETPRARVDEEGDLALAQAECLGCRPIVDRVQPLELDEVVPRTKRAELAGAPLAGPCGHRPGVGAVQSPAGLSEVQVARGPDPEVLEQRPRPVLEDAVELHALQSAIGAT